MTDQFYIQKVTEGDTESFRFLIDRYKDKAFSVAFSVLRNQTLAEDAVQEAFIKAFQKLHTFRGEAAFLTWMMRMEVNESIKVLRKKKKEIEGQLEINFVNEPELITSLQTLKEAEQRKFIDKTLEQMPQREALVLQLYYLEDLNLKELEPILDLKADNIKVIIFRARKRFYEILQHELKHELSTII